jgi:hypothetical protein
VEDLQRLIFQVEAARGPMSQVEILPEHVDHDDLAPFDDD